MVIGNLPIRDTFLAFPAFFSRFYIVTVVEAPRLCIVNVKFISNLGTGFSLFVFKF